MKSIKYLTVAAAIMAALATTDVQAKRKMMPQMHMFGFSASFKDSVVYFTNIQTVDSVWIDTKTKFLLGRDSYSYQLKDYFSHNAGKANRTCIVIFAEKRKDIEKKFMKLRRKYTDKAKNKYDVRSLTDAEFAFKPVDMNTIYDDIYDTTAEKPQPKKRGKKKEASNGNGE